MKELQVMQTKIWDVAAHNFEVVDFHEVMYKFTLDSFIMLGFGVELNSLSAKEKVPFAVAFDEAQKNTFLRFVNPVWSVTERIAGLLMPWKTSMNEHLAVVDGFAREVTEKRRAQLAAGEIHTDLLSRFMDARNNKGNPLSNDELRDIVLNFVIAGRDTTAQALSWTFYMLMCHPRVEKKLLEEINQHITDVDNLDAPTLYEKIKSMNYAHAVYGFYLYKHRKKNDKLILFIVFMKYFDTIRLFHSIKSTL